MTRLRTIRDSATAGARARWAKPSRLISNLARAFLTKIILLVVIFLAVPVIIYDQFRAADEEKAALILRSARDQGRLLADSLRPLFGEFTPAAISRLNAAMPVIAGPDAKTKVLYRPGGSTGPDQFYYVAAVPNVPTEYLEAERAELIGSGILGRVRESCAGVGPIAARYINPSGQEELLTSLTPFNIGSGCWVVITSRSTEDFLGSTLGRPYWTAPEIRVAAAIYVLMALFVVLLFTDAWRSLRSFEGLARAIRTQGRLDRSFAESNTVPELGSVAREFDRLTDKLHESAELIRHAAEENAHAFKTPIAVISQSLEPIRRSMPLGDPSNARAIERIEQSVQRLDSLVAAARRLDEASAELLDPRSARILLAPMLERICESYRDAAGGGGPVVAFHADTTAAAVLAGQELMETVFENVIENAIGFSPADGIVSVGLSRTRDRVLATVEDGGPGVPPERLDQIFDRYYSHRPAAPSHALDEHGGHFGIGLWVVRRNVESVGGSVRAENRHDGPGLRVVMSFPAA